VTQHVPGGGRAGDISPPVVTAPPLILTQLDGELILVDPFIGADEARTVLAVLLREIAWHEEEIAFFGKSVRVPRLVCWYGDAGAVYTYSGVRHEPLPWSATLRELKQRVETYTRQQFNSVLCNLYRDGNDSMGWHADKEKELGDAPYIASLSFGAPRLFRARHNKSKQTLGVVLNSGSLLTMSGAFQRHWRHSVPKDRATTQPRVNLTFRRIVAVR
jgi:alkylated DNA repair dioxygenase AlkB